MSQVVRVAKLSGGERPLEVLYFVEGPGGERIPAEVTAATLNRLDRSSESCHRPWTSSPEATRSA